ncbi:hypothetical protein GGI20_004315 [Coemansia sp. BCRC 34301]|nr:hypothetical protein GGI20_004315 [Coemansia sp. BCRC 34301]
MDSSAQAAEPCAVPSLKELCQRTLVSNVERIRHLGVTPQFLIADALAQCTPEQLGTLEHYNPHIVNDNERLWMSHCLRKHRELRVRLEDGTMDPVPSWRALYWDMRRQDEIRAQEILQKVRVKAAAVERERSARKIQVSRTHAKEVLPRGSWRPSKQPRELSLVQRARIDTLAHMEMLGAGRRQRSAKQSTLLPQGDRALTTHSRHESPAGSPAQSPPHYNSLQSYSPPYFSSASSCSPPHSSYSPPYVPELGGNNGHSDSSPGIDFFEDMFGVPSGGAYTKALPETVVIREQTMLRPRPSSAAAKRRRRDSELEGRPESVESSLDTKRSRKTDMGAQAHVAATQTTSGDKGALSPANNRLGDKAKRRIDDFE